MKEKDLIEQLEKRIKALEEGYKLLFDTLDTVNKILTKLKT